MASKNWCSAHICGVVWWHCQGIEWSDMQSLEVVEGFSCRCNVIDTSHAKFWVYSNSLRCGTIHVIHWKSDSGFTGKGCWHNTSCWTCQYIEKRLVWWSLSCRHAISYYICMRAHQGMLRFTICRHHKLHGGVLDKLDETIILDPQRSTIGDLQPSLFWITCRMKSITDLPLIHSWQCTT